VDPRDMFNQVRSDCASNRWTGFVLAGIFALGMATWGHVLSARVLSTRTAVRRTSHDRPQISVLPDPFADQQH
jgi:hypothetical protein